MPPREDCRRRGRNRPSTSPGTALTLYAVVVIKDTNIWPRACTWNQGWIQALKFRLLCSVWGQFLWVPRGPRALCPQGRQS